MPAGFGEAWTVSGTLVHNGQSIGIVKFREGSEQVELIITAPKEAVILDAWDIQHP
jgi:hypothetical protein